MRLPLLAAILLHLALFAVAWRLPAVELSRQDRSISVEIRAPQPVPELPKPEQKPEPPKPEPPKKLASRTEPKRTQPDKPEPLKPEPKPEATPEPPKPEQKPEAKPEQKPERSVLTMRPSAPVDLRLHALPGQDGVTVQPGALAGGEGGPGGTIATGPRKPWRPRGDAGDPLLGKLPEQKEERFPLRSLGREGWAYDGPSFSARIKPDGSVSFDNKVIRDFKGLSGGFDVTDLIMRGKKQDPYRYEKERFMETTADLRSKMRTKSQRETMEAAVERLPSQLAHVWADESATARERRHAIYAMWREAADADSATPAAAKARAAIEAFIRDRLPVGSEDAFTDEELRRYNSKAGALRFDPYKSP